ncbi:MAG: SDR family oxidoreductase, partial [Bdellovibrionales bacterium]|nr:SDR family oxidoreductase [Bdellovibrionales bacterium]
ILILGAGGMLGHKLAFLLNKNFEIYTTTRSPYSLYKKFEIFDPNRHIDQLDVLDESALSLAVKKIEPRVIINCVGLTTRKIDTQDSSLVIKTNSLLPHNLTAIAKRIKARVIHFSTDCVFSGSKGNYKESDLTDSRDLYGLSKVLGEVNHEPCLTLRSSIIGREILHHTELLEWLVSMQDQQVRGFSRVYYTGVTTNLMVKVVEDIILNHPELFGVYQLASPKISKYELLNLINEALQLNVSIQSDSQYQSDKSLDGSRLAKIVQSADKITWEDMIVDLIKEDKRYKKWKYNDT